MLGDNAMPVLQWLSVALFLGLWAVIGWKDFTHQKIKHDLIVYGAGGALAGYALLLFLTLLGRQGVVLHYPLLSFYRMVASHLALSVLAGMLLWWLGIWPAGDAKLFILLGAVYPLMNITAPAHFERLFLAALINTFLPAALFLFLRAVHYIYDTRLRHSYLFLKQLGWKRQIGFFSGQTREIVVAALRELPGKLKALWAFATADPKALAGMVGSWFISMLGMALFSSYLSGFFSSPLRLSILWTCLFMLWRRAVELFGPVTRFAGGAAVVALLYFKPPSDWHHFAHIFQNITVFSFFMFLGMNWAVKIISGGGGLPFLIPFVLPLLGMAVGQVWSYASNFLRALWRVTFGALGRLPIRSPHDLGLWRATPLAHRVGSSAHVALTVLHDVAGGLNNQTLRTIFVLSSMGLFFGLSLVMVRIWDQEVRPTRTAKTLSPYVLLAPAFIDRIRQDPEFFELHFTKLYPDGLTRSQVEALQEWCERHAIETIPLAPTMSFAAWIFLGYFLTHLLGGGHVLEALL